MASDCIRAQAAFDRADRQHFPKPARRSSKLFEISPTLGRLVEVEIGVSHVLDVEGYAETKDEHQQRGADERKGEAHWISAESAWSR